jgi:hypothetical protein
MLDKKNSVVLYDTFLAPINIWTLNTKLSFKYTLLLSGVSEDWNRQSIFIGSLQYVFPYSLWALSHRGVMLHDTKSSFCGIMSNVEGNSCGVFQGIGMQEYQLR